MRSRSCRRETIRTSRSWWTADRSRTRGDTRRPPTPAIRTSTIDRSGRRTCCGGNTSRVPRCSSSGSRGEKTASSYGDYSFSRDFGAVFDAPAKNVFLVKFAYWFNPVSDGAFREGTKHNSVPFDVLRSLDRRVPAAASCPPPPESDARVPAARRRARAGRTRGSSSGARSRCRR